MERIDGVLEKIYDQYPRVIDKEIKDTDMDNEFSMLLENGERLKEKKIEIKNIIRSEEELKELIIKYIICLLEDYGEFKKVPSYYKIIDGKAQDYVFIKEESKTIKGFKVIEKSVYTEEGFVNEELYFIKNVGFYKFNSVVIENEGYKEFYRSSQYSITDPSEEWKFLNLLKRINDLLNIKFDKVSRLLERENEICVFLKSWSDDLNILLSDR